MLRRHLPLLLLVWTIAWPAAATAPAADAQTVAFDVTVHGSQRTVVTGVRRSVDDLGCSVTRTDLERQTLTFTSRRPARLLAAPGRPASARVAVAVQARGTKLSTRTFSGSSPECDLPPDTRESACGPARLAGHTLVTLPTFGSVRVTGSLARRRDEARCRPTAARARPFLARAEGHFPAALVTDRGAARIVLRGDARYADTFESGARRVTTVQWTVVLRRIS